MRLSKVLESKRTRAKLIKRISFNPKLYVNIVFLHIDFIFNIWGVRVDNFGL